MWNGQVYVSTGCFHCSALKIFNAVADVIEWCATQEGVDHIFHYLAVLGRAETRKCLQSLLALKRVCESLGIPLATDKQDGPSPVITLLGITINTLKGELRLP